MKQLIFFLLTSSVLILNSCNYQRSSSIETIETWDNGKVKKVVQWMDEKDSTYNQITYFKTGQVKTEKIFIKGKLEKFTAYHETGELAALFIYVNNKPVAGSEYFKNGQKMGDVPRNLNGRINGPVKYYYENGRLRGDGYYNDDKPDGLWRDYDKDGNITSEKLFDNDKQLENKKK